MTPSEIIYHPLIIPSVVIPFTAVLALLSALATFIAGLFGLQLKAEGPKKLLEVMLKPRVLFVALVSNLILIGGVAGFRYWKNLPLMEWRIERQQRQLAKPSSLSYPNGESNPTQAPASPIAGSIEVLWTKQLDSGSFRGATVSGDSLFFGVDSGNVHELDVKTGELRRSFFVGTAVSPNPLVFDGKLYVGEGMHDTHHARLYQFDLASGNYVNSFTTKGHIEGEPFAAELNGEKLVLVVSGVDGVHALEPGTLKSRWHVVDGHVDSAVNFANGLVFSGTGMEKEKKGTNKTWAVAYDFQSGKQAWKRELPASSWMQPLPVGELVCFVYGEVYFASNLGGFFCYRQKDGQPSIVYNNAAPIASNPIAVHGDIVTADLNGKICRVSLENGLAKWCQETGKAGFALGNPIWDQENGLLVYAAQSGGVFVLHPDSGKVLSQWTPGKEEKPWGKTYAPLVLADRSWIVVDMKGVVRKLRWQTTKPAKVAGP